MFLNVFFALREPQNRYFCLKLNIFFYDHYTFFINSSQYVRNCNTYADKCWTVETVLGHLKFNRKRETKRRKEDERERTRDRIDTLANWTSSEIRRVIRVMERDV